MLCNVSVGDITYSSVASQFFSEVLHEHDINVLQTYGCTEIGSLTQFLTRASEVAALGLGASGTAVPGCDLKVRTLPKHKLRHLNYLLHFKNAVYG